MVIYALQTEQSIGRMFLAGMVPGFLAAGLYMVAIYLVATFKPDWAPSTARPEKVDRLAAVRQMSPILALFLLVMGGIYAGFFSPTEAAGVGAFGAIVLAALRGRLSWAVSRDALLETASTTGMLFLILIGTSVLQFFIETSTLPRVIVEWMGALGLPPIGIIIVILFIYVILGCFLDSLSMMLITLPIVFPMITKLGYDPIWFGILVTSVVEIGLITPPLGMNLFVITASVEKLEFETVVLGVIPFLIADFVRLTLLVAIPALSLALPKMLM
jgi:tripartite ATP-independent transporter DctM subunit